jgi:hypothetical protein
MVVLAVAAAGIGVGGVMNALASSDDPATATVCIRPNGQIRAVTPANPVCVEPETPSAWTVHGVKAITTGAGLVGRDDGGLVQLQVDPELIENANSGRIVAGFDDGPHDVPDLEPSTIAELPLPAGSYAIFAKLQLVNTFLHGAASVRCRLDAGGDFDETDTDVEGFGIALEQSTSSLAQGLEVVHRFAAPGSAVLRCADSSVRIDGALVGGGVLYRDLKIVAIRGSSLSNTFLGK